MNVDNVTLIQMELLSTLLQANEQEISMPIYLIHNCNSVAWYVEIKMFCVNTKNRALLKGHWPGYQKL